MHSGIGSARGLRPSWMLQISTGSSEASAVPPAWGATIAAAVSGKAKEGVEDESHHTTIYRYRREHKQHRRQAMKQIKP